MKGVGPGRGRSGGPRAAGLLGGGAAPAPRARGTARLGPPSCPAPHSPHTGTLARLLRSRSGSPRPGGAGAAACGAPRGLPHFKAASRRGRGSHLAPPSGSSGWGVHLPGLSRGAAPAPLPPSLPSTVRGGPRPRRGEATGGSPQWFRGALGAAAGRGAGAGGPGQRRRGSQEAAGGPRHQGRLGGLRGRPGGPAEAVRPPTPRSRPG